MDEGQRPEIDGATARFRQQVGARYWEKRVLISDPEVAALTISGVFLLDRPESVLYALKLSHGLETVKLNSHTLHLLKTSQ